MKEAGLKWEPKLGDIFVGYFNNELGTSSTDIVLSNNFGKPGPEHIWFPHLDQLLTEIERRGYGWKLEKFHAYNLRRMEIYKVNDLLGCFEDNSPEEAAAQSLLWILQKEEAR